LVWQADPTPAATRQGTEGLPNAWATCQGPRGLSPPPGESRDKIASRAGGGGFLGGGIMEPTNRFWAWGQGPNKRRRFGIETGGRVGQAKRRLVRAGEGITARNKEEGGRKNARGRFAVSRLVLGLLMGQKFDFATFTWIRKGEPLRSARKISGSRTVGAGNADRCGGLWVFWGTPKFFGPVENAWGLNGTGGGIILIEHPRRCR